MPKSTKLFVAFLIALGVTGFFGGLGILIWRVRLYIIQVPARGEGFRATILAELAIAGLIVGLALSVKMISYFVREVWKPSLRATLKRSKRAAN